MVIAATQNVPATPERSEISTPIRDLPHVLLETPRAGVDIRKQVTLLRARQSPTKRAEHLVPRKFMKALDMKNVLIADLQYKIKSLEQVIRRLRPKKRAKVTANPNKRFVGLPEVQLAMKKARAAQRQKNNLESIEFHGFD